MRCSNPALCLLGSVLCLFAAQHPARAADLDPKDFYGTWELSDPRVKGTTITTVKLADGSCEPGVWGREFGGPNPIGANTWRIKEKELAFVYVKAGRAREDIMLSGTIKLISPDEFEFKVTGGFYGGGKNKDLVFRLKRQ